MNSDVRCMLRALFQKRVLVMSGGIVNVGMRLEWCSDEKWVYLRVMLVAFLVTKLDDAPGIF